MSDNMRNIISKYCENAIDSAIKFYNEAGAKQTNKILSRYDEATSRMELFSRTTYGIIPYYRNSESHQMNQKSWF